MQTMELWIFWGKKRNGERFLVPLKQLFTRADKILLFAVSTYPISWCKADIK